MKCPNCGGEINKPEVICPYCKSTINSPQKPVVGGSKGTKPKNLKRQEINLKDIRKLWKEANKALKKKDIDRFIRKLGAAVEQAVIYKHILVFGEGPPNIKWGMKNLREKGLIKELQSNLNWVWDTRNELTHIAVDLKSKEVQRALKIGQAIMKGCL